MKKNRPTQKFFFARKHDSIILHFQPSPPQRIIIKQILIIRTINIQYSYIEYCLEITKNQVCFKKKKKCIFSVILKLFYFLDIFNEYNSKTNFEFKDQIYQILLFYIL